MSEATLSAGVASAAARIEERTIGLRWLAIACCTAIGSLLVAVGADARWLATLGAAIVDRGSIPDGLPYAAAPSAGWPNVPVAGELVFHWLESGLAERGLVLAQLAAVAAALVLCARDIRGAQATESAAAATLVLVFVAGFSQFVVARAQLFSLALFPLVVLLLRSESRLPSRRIWLLVPLLALWSNLHGAVLVGLCVAGAYLLVDRLRREPLTALAVLVASGIAVCATPALWRTPEYYLGVLGNEAARRGIGLWSPLTFGSAMDIAFVVAAAALVGFALRARPRAWELIALVGLVAMSVHAARSGVWLALFAAAPAASGMGMQAVARVRFLAPVTVATACVLAAAFVFSLARGPLRYGAGEALIGEAIAAADGDPILAEDLLAEQLADSGGRVWIANPIDAFRRVDQRRYVDWLEGVPVERTFGTQARVVVVREGSAAQRELAGDQAFHEAARDERAVLYLRSE